MIPVFNTLPSDVLLSISHHLNVVDIANLTALNRAFRELLDNDAFFMAVACEQFSSEFWRRASRRDQAPCKTIKAELMRIERFQYMIMKYDGKRWNEQDFFQMWKAERNSKAGLHTS